MQTYPKSASFQSQAFYGAHQRRLQRLIAHRQQGDDNDPHDRGRKDPPGQRSMIQIPLQPLAHAIIRQGYGYQDRDAGELQEFFGEQAPEIGEACAKDFAHADLFGALFGYEGGEAEKPETGDKDGQAGEDCGEVAYTLFTFEFGSIGFVHECIDKGTRRIVFFEDGSHGDEGLVRIVAGFDLYDHLISVTAADEDGAFGGVVRVIVDHVSADAHDCIGFSEELDDLADWIFETDGSDGFFIEDRGVTVGREIAGQVTATGDSPADGFTVVGCDIDVVEAGGILIGAFAGPVEKV